MALDYTQIELVLQNTQASLVGIDDGDIVVLTDQVFRQSAADLTGTQNDYLHR
jgi:acid phosphatase class B